MRIRDIYFLEKVMELIYVAVVRCMIFFQWLRDFLLSYGLMDQLDLLTDYAFRCRKLVMILFQSTPLKSAHSIHLLFCPCHMHRFEQ